MSIVFISSSNLILNMPYPILESQYNMFLSFRPLLKGFLPYILSPGKDFHLGVFLNRKNNSPSRTK